MHYQEWMSFFHPSCLAKERRKPIIESPRLPIQLDYLESASSWDTSCWYCYPQPIAEKGNKGAETNQQRFVLSWTTSINSDFHSCLPPPRWERHFTDLESVNTCSSSVFLKTRQSFEIPNEIPKELANRLPFSPTAVWGDTWANICLKHQCTNWGYNCRKDAHVHSHPCHYFPVFFSKQPHWSQNSIRTNCISALIPQTSNAHTTCTKEHRQYVSPSPMIILRGAHALQRTE